MRLTVVHQVLIAAAIALGLLFGARCAALYARDLAPMNLALLILSWGLVIALSVYLRRFRAKLRTHHPEMRR